VPKTWANLTENGTPKAATVKKPAKKPAAAGKAPSKAAAKRYEEESVCTECWSYRSEVEAAGLTFEDRGIDAGDHPIGICSACAAKEEPKPAKGKKAKDKRADARVAS
jgi:hypothetical protein